MQRSDQGWFARDARLASIAVAIVMGAGCTVGAPPGFSDGERWVFPLVGPLEDGLLVTPVTIRGKGPYLFAIDPDANVSALDTVVVQEAALRMGSGPRRLDESDTTQIRFYAEVLDLKVAGLSIDRRDVMVFPVGFYDTESRHLHGILGRDAIADSLVFGFDRDQGIATLMTTKAFQPPPESTAIKYSVVSSESMSGMPRQTERQYDPDPNRATREATLPVADAGDVLPVPRRLVSAQIGAAKLTMHLDLGSATSQLAQAKWTAAQLDREELELRVTDEAVVARKIKSVAIAPVVTLGAAQGDHVVFAPFADKRFPTARIDGVLGLDFFRPYAVYANWDRTTFYLKQRGDLAATLAARIGRWGDLFAKCAHAGCVTAEISKGANGIGLSVVRDPELGNRAIEVYLGVSSAAGKPAGAVVVELPAHVSEVRSLVPAEYEGATVAVLDVSPFTRPCVGEGGCVMPLAGASALEGGADGGVAPSAPPPDGAGPGAQEPSGGPATASAPPGNVALDKLQRTGGDPAIAPSADVRTSAGSKPFAVAIVRVCLTADGKVESTKMTKSSGVPAYDQQLQDTLKATWTFAPSTASGTPQPVCTSATFVAPK